MDREGLVSVVKLAAAVAVAIALLLVWVFGGDAWFRPVAAVTLVVVAAPVALLVSIDTARILRRGRLRRAAAIATRLPRLVLGSIACVTAVGGVDLALAGGFPTLWHRIGCAFISLCILSYGVSLLRPDPLNAKK
jgi:hypothetical protein